MLFNRFQCKLVITCFLALVIGSFTGVDLLAREVAVVEGAPPTQYPFTDSDNQFLDQVAKGCFNYLWNEVGVPARLAKDRRTTPVASLAGVGFQLASLPIGSERGWITREQGLERAQIILRTLRDAPGNRRHGVFLHFVNADNGRIYPPYNNEISTVDHTLFLAGAMTAASYFGGEVAEIVHQLATETNWREYQRSDTGLITFAWKLHESGDVDGPGEYTTHEWHLATDEERLVYFVAAGSPNEDFDVSPESYYKLKRHVGQYKEMQPYVLSWNGLLFTYFFSHCYIDYRNMGPDDPAQFGGEGPRVDWFENSRRATLAHRQACLDLADKYRSFGDERWGLSPCMGQVGSEPQWNYIVQELQPNIRGNDDLKQGTIAPYAAGSCIMFTPRESLAALRAFQMLKDKYGEPLVWRDPAMGAYAFADSFNLDQNVACDDNVAIDVGPMLLAIENARTGLIWKLFMEHDDARRAAERLKLFPAN